MIMGRFDCKQEKLCLVEHVSRGQLGNKRGRFPDVSEFDGESNCVK